MTIKEAFEALGNACAKGMKNPFFVMKRLKDAFADVANKVVDAGGSTVTVTPIVESGIKIATITVDGDDSDLYTPNITPLHVYDEDEHLVGRWFHDDIAEDVYEKTIPVSDVTLTQNQQTAIYTDSNIKLFRAFGYLVESGITYILPETGIRIKQDSLAIYLMATNSSWNECNGYITIQYTKITS